MSNRDIEEKQEPYISTAEAAELFGVKPFTVLAWWKTGRVRGYRLGHRTMRFRLSELLEDTKNASKVAAVNTKERGYSGPESERGE